MFLDYLIEYIGTLVYTVGAFLVFAVLTCFFMMRFFKAHRKYFIKILKVVLILVLIINSICFWCWVNQVPDDFNSKTDGFISSLPYLAMEWQDYYYVPVYPLMDLGQTAAVFFAFALIQITSGLIVSLWYLHWRHNNRDAVLAITTFFILQYLALGIGSYLILFYF